MIRTTIVQYFDNYSEHALNQVVATCKGKLLFGFDGVTPVGTIVSGKIVSDFGIQFVVDIDAI